MVFPVWPLLGGTLIGLSAILLMVSIGRIAGMSGIFWGALSAPYKAWRYLFVAGLIIGAGVFHMLSGRPMPVANLDIPLVVIAGLLVGIGTKLGNGCTSGHGVCGISRFSRRSLVATAVFMLSAILTVWIKNHGVS